MKNEPKILWANAINTYGLWFKTPRKVIKEDENDFWSDKDGDFCVDKVGLDEDSGHVIFSSENKNDVILWSQGCKNAIGILRSLVGSIK